MSAPAAAPVTLREALEEVRRELNMRAHVYPRLIERGQLHPAAAEEQNRRMRAVEAWLARQCE